MEPLPKPERVAFSQPRWPDHDARAMARDFLLWRHLRVVRARAMRHVNAFAQKLTRRSPDHGVRTTYGVRMMPNWHDRTYAYCHYGTYGPYLADLLAAIDQPFVFLDVGANQGLFSLIAGKNPACEAIVALEPVPETHLRLRRNLGLNGLSERAEPLNFGLSDRNWTCPITIDRQHSGLATLGDHLEPSHAGVVQLEVEMRTIHALAEHLPSHLPIFVKIDVEGHEITVIEQILGSHHADRVMGIFYEHDDRWSDHARLDAAFGRAGFEVHRQYGRGKHYDALAVPARA